MLDAFGDYGGETFTLALLPTSPAIDAGDEATCAATDQRGLDRPQGAVCDIGAYEYERPRLTLNKTVIPTSVVPGQALTYTLSFANTGGDLAETVVITDLVPAQVTVISYQLSADPGISLSHTLSNQSVAVFESASLSPGQGGVITLTAVLSDPLFSGRFTNTALIAAANVETATANNRAEANLWVNNLAPILAPIGNHTITETLTLSFTVSASDPNDDTLTYGLLNGPAGASLNSFLNSFNESKGQFNWQPTLGQAGTYTFTVVVSDTDLLTDSETIVVSVNDLEDSTTWVHHIRQAEWKIKA